MAITNNFSALVDKIINYGSDLMETVSTQGYIRSPIYNSDKVAGGTRDAVNGDFCYILRQPNGVLGTELAVETFYADNLSTTTRGSTLKLNLPFRMPIADTSIINEMFFTDQPVTGSNLNWNPGLTVDFQGKMNTNLGILSKYIELNLTTNQLNSLVGKNVKLYNHTTPDPVHMTASSIRADILEPRMYVIGQGINDLIVISYTARVKVTGKFGTFKNNVWKTISTAPIYWTVPYVVAFQTTKATIRTETLTNVNDYYWSFAFDRDKETNIVSLNGLGGTLATKTYDYNIIPHYDKTHSVKGRIYYCTWPVTLGCKTDMIYDITRSQVITVCAAARIKPSTKTMYVKTISTRFVLVALGFNAPTESVIVPNYSLTTKNYAVTRVAIALNTDTLLITTSRRCVSTVKTRDNTTDFSIYDVAVGFASDGFTSNIKLSNCTVTPYLDGFLIGGQRGKLFANIIYHPTTATKSATYDVENTLPVGASVSATLPRVVDDGSKVVILHDTPYMFSKAENREVYPDVSISTTDIIVRPWASGFLSIDIPTKTNLINSYRYSIMLPWLFGYVEPSSEIYTVYDHNESNTADYFYIKNKTENGYAITDKVISHIIYPISFSGVTIQPEYWANPQFAVSESEGENLGVHLIVSLLNCAGLYTLGAIEAGDAWDPDARPAATYAGGVIHGGIPLDPARTRSDINYTYYGTEAGYQLQQPPDGVTRFGGSYYLVYENDCDVQLTYKGTNILAGSNYNDTITVHPVCWKYNQLGQFNMYLDLFLNLDGITGDDNVSTFTDAGFVMTGCRLSVDLKNRYGSTLDRLVEETFTITPPSVFGYINSAVGNKTISDGMTFTLYRDVDASSATFSTIRNVKFNYYDHSLGTYDSYLNTPSNYIEDSNHNGAAEETLTFDPNIALEKGDFVYVSYEPRVNDSRSIAGTTRNSTKVSNVKGHRYHIDNVQLLFSGLGGWEDVTSDVEDGKIYYANLDAMNIRATFDADPESWPGRDDLAAHQIYPYIKNVYAFAVKRNSTLLAAHVDPYGVQPTVQYEIEVPVDDMPTTYPNHTDAFGLLMKNRYLGISGSIPASTSGIRPNDTTLTTFNAGVYNLDMRLDEPGEYQLYAIIEDEFDQQSCFCLTNIANNYKIPFRRI